MIVDRHDRARKGRKLLILFDRCDRDHGNNLVRKLL